MQSGDPDHIWDVPSYGEPKPAHSRDASALRRTVIAECAPLDAQRGVISKKSVPDPLRADLFGPASAGAKDLLTYAILDAARIINLPEQLDTSGLDHRCLFQGDALETFGDMAPWIVCLEEENSFTRNLFTAGDAPWNLWDREPGIYFRSAAKLDALWGHLRKFTLVKSADGGQFFRFWDPATLGHYLTLIGPNPDEVAAFCCGRLTSDAWMARFILCTRTRTEVHILDHAAIATDEDDRAAELAPINIDKVRLIRPRLSWDKYRRYLRNAFPARVEDAALQNDWLRTADDMGRALMIDSELGICRIATALGHLGHGFVHDPRFQRFGLTPQALRFDVQGNKIIDAVKRIVACKTLLTSPRPAEALRTICAEDGLAVRPVSDLLTTLDPAGTEAWGPRQLGDFVAMAAEFATRMGLADHATRGMFALLAYEFGIGFATDPTLPFRRDFATGSAETYSRAIRDIFDTEILGKG